MPGASSWLGVLPLAEFGGPCYFEAVILSKTVNDVETEPELQPVTGEIIEGLSENALRPNIRARGVWRASQNAFFDVRVTNTLHHRFPSQQKVF